MAQLQTPLEFLEEFCKKASNAKEQILLQSMNFESGEILDRIVPILIKKAESGVDVQLHIDWVYQRYIHSNLPIMPFVRKVKKQQINKIKKSTENLMEKLKDAGVHITIVNNPSFISYFFPYIRRNHIKIYIIDDSVGWIGGVNLFDDAFTNIDFMVKFVEDNKLKVLIDQFFRINKNRRRDNYVHPLDKDYVFMNDRGYIGNSLIYNKAVNLVKHAQKSVSYISQVVPDGELLQQMIIKSKSIPIQIITSSRRDDKFIKYPIKISYDIFRLKIKSHPNIHINHLTKRVHAKLLVIDNEKVIFGSHNLFFGSVLLGTEEIAIYCKNISLVRQCDDYLDTLL